jgi:hypothetical protein
MPPRLPGIGLTMPSDFPSAPYEAIRKRMLRSYNILQPQYARLPPSLRTQDTEQALDPYVHFARAWTALAHRYLSCTAHGLSFSKSIVAGEKPSARERHRQGHDLFGFFVTGLSAIESLCYGLFFIGRAVSPNTFPLPAHGLRDINVSYTAGKFNARKFKRAFKNDSIGDKLDTMTRSTNFRDWTTIRNVLAHRVTPLQVLLHPFGGGPSRGYTVWQVHDVRDPISLDEQFTITQRQWLTNTINDILDAADSFTAATCDARLTLTDELSSC